MTTPQDTASNLASSKDAERDEEQGYHELLMAYGKICEEQGFLSQDAVQVRMDLAAHYLDLNALYAKREREAIQYHTQDTAKEQPS